MIDQGEDIELICTFRTDGQLVDPMPPVSLRVRRPTGEIDEVADVDRRAEGVYVHRYSVGEAGSYTYSFYSFDNAIQQGQFYAKPDTQRV